MVDTRCTRAIEELRRRREELPQSFTASVEDHAGHARGYISRVLSGKIHQLDSEALLAILEHPWIDARAMLEHVGVTVTASPVPYLIRIEKQTKPDLTLRKLEHSVEQCTSGTGNERFYQEIAKIDELRFSDSAQASQALEHCLTSYPLHTPRDLCRALTSYAEDRRLAMYFGRAARALRIAARVADTSEEWAIYLQRAAYLLANQGWFSRADSVVCTGIDVCLAQDNHAIFGKLLVTRAMLNRSLGNVSATKNLCMHSLSYLPEDAWTYHFGTYLDLAWCYYKLGDDRQSVEYLDRAEAMHQTKQGINWLKVSWFRGDRALFYQRPVEAEMHYRQMLEALDPETDPVYVAIISLLLCKAYWSQERFVDIVGVAKSMIALLMSFSENDVASAAILHFYDLVQTGKLTLAAIEETKQVIEKSRRATAPTQAVR